MSRSSSKEAILDAAEAIVIELGASHMTLDAVAERSGISKGGLMYNFPSKEALLEAMIDRMKERFNQLRDNVRRDLPRNRANELLVEIRILQGNTDAEHRLCAALLAAASNQPDLAHRVRDEWRERFLNKIASTGDFTRSAILFFAAMGIHFGDLLNLSLLDAQQRKAIFDELVRLAGKVGDLMTTTTTQSPPKSVNHLVKARKAAS